MAFSYEAQPRLGMGGAPGWVYLVMRQSAQRCESCEFVKILFNISLTFKFCLRISW